MLRSVGAFRAGEYFSNGQIFSRAIGPLPTITTTRWHWTGWFINYRSLLIGLRSVGGDQRGDLRCFCNQKGPQFFGGEKFVEIFFLPRLAYMFVQVVAPKAKRRIGGFGIWMDLWCTLRVRFATRKPREIGRMDQFSMVTECSSSLEARCDRIKQSALYIVGEKECLTFIVLFLWFSSRESCVTGVRIFPGEY